MENVHGQHYVYVDLHLLQIPGCLKININSTLDRYKGFRLRIYPRPGSEQYLDRSWVVQIGSVLVRSKCLDEHICFAPNPWIGPGSEHHVNWVLDRYTINPSTN